jgi:hypothetical protein
MQLVAWTVNHGGNDIEDHYTIHETAEDAARHFQTVLGLDNCHCAALGSVTDATEPQWLDPTPRKVWSLVIDTDGGTTVELFTTEAAREARCASVVADWWGKDNPHMPADWRDALAQLSERLCDFWLVLNDHEVTL